MEFIAGYFGFKERGTTARTELGAGLATFLTMLYGAMGSGLES